MMASKIDNGTVKYLPVLIALVTLWVSLVIEFVAILVINSGVMVYTLDDAYIHLAISKNIHNYHIFGITRYGFSSSSSSPFWNLILSAVFVLVGVSDMVPLVLNIIFASVAVVVLFELLKDMGMSLKYLTAVLLSFVFFTSLPGLVFTGMEHMLHVFLSMTLFVLSAKILSAEESNIEQSIVLLVVTLLSSAVRIETIFLVFPIIMLFLMKRKWLYALAIFSMASLPWAIYGIVSIENGWLLLPNSLLVKSVDAMNEGIRYFFVRGVGAVLISPHLVALIIASIKLTSSKEYGFWHIGNVMRVIFVTACLLHVYLGRVGWFFRYEAYLVAIGVIAISIQGRQFLSNLDLASIRMPIIGTGLERKRLYGLGLVVLFIAPLAGRGILVLYLTPIASNNIYDQQYQMGLFLDRFYTGDTVLINDIGCVNYLSDIHCVDKWGIASLEIGEFLLNGSMSPSVLKTIAIERGVEIAVVYADNLIPAEWEEVGSWTIPDNIVASNNTVSFFAVMPSERDRLIGNLVLFSSELPENVIQRGLYTTLL